MHRILKLDHKINGRSPLTMTHEPPTGRYNFVVAATDNLVLGLLQPLQHFQVAPIFREGVFVCFCLKISFFSRRDAILLIPGTPICTGPSQNLKVAPEGCLDTCRGIPLKSIGS